MSESVSSDPVGHSADLRTRIAAVVAAHRDQCGDCSCGWESWEESWDMHLADAVIRELNPAAACEGGCMWQIPNHVENMTDQQRELLKRAGDERN